MYSCRFNAFILEFEIYISMISIIQMYFVIQFDCLDKSGVWIVKLKIVFRIVLSEKDVFHRSKNHQHSNGSQRINKNVFLACLFSTGFVFIDNYNKNVRCLIV